MQFFHEADPASLDTPYVCPWEGAGCRNPRVLQSHGWIDGRLHEAFHEESFDIDDPSSWPHVEPVMGVAFSGRGPNEHSASTTGPMRVLPHLMREPSDKSPLLSVVFVRQGSEFIIEHQGRYSCPPSDLYMSSMVGLGVKAHPLLMGDTSDVRFDFEIFSVFVECSEDLAQLASMAPRLAARLQGIHKTAFWMLWPTEWEDCGGTDLGYVEKGALFSAMRACEAAGVSSGFPHPADQYELITSKSWMATLSLDPKARLPAAVMVTTETALRDPMHAAKQALTDLECIRHQNPRAPAEWKVSSVNEHRITKGVVKLGWSWEAKDVLQFSGEEQLRDRMMELLTQTGCTASACLVQEWVDFDFEMRLFFFPPTKWVSTQRLQPARVECTAWSEPCGEGRPRGFHMLSEERCLSRWDQDRDAFQSAKEQSVEISQHLLGWLFAVDCRPIPMIRLDFMVRRLGSGKAFVTFGEFCEAGGEIFGWKDGCPTMWRAALDHVLSRA